MDTGNRISWFVATVMLIGVFAYFAILCGNFGTLPEARIIYSLVFNVGSTFLLLRFRHETMPVFFILSIFLVTFIVVFLINAGVIGGCYFPICVFLGLLFAANIIVK